MAIADEPMPMPSLSPLPVARAADGPVADFEALLGNGTDLWADDAEYEAFLAELRRWRRADCDEGRQP